MKQGVHRDEKKDQTEDDDVRAWTVIGLIFCAAALAAWLPLILEL